MNTRLILLILALALCPAMRLAARTSADYSIPAETEDAGGRRTTAGLYTIDNSVGAIGALNSGGGNTGKHGYIGQLYDLVGLVLTATPTSVNETLTRQLFADQLFDDFTTDSLAASSVIWSVLSGPIVSINSSGLATAGNVYQNTSATVEGSYLSKSGSLNLTVLNVGTDDFDAYESDGIDDAWQVQYFGENNANAEPNADPDGDSQNNLFEFTAGLIPTDPTSRFALAIQNVNSSQKNLIFNPLVAGRTYTPQFTTTITNSASWGTPTGTSQSDNGVTRTVTDPNATGATKVYRVQISKP